MAGAFQPDKIGYRGHVTILNTVDAGFSIPVEKWKLYGSAFCSLAWPAVSF